MRARGLKGVCKRRSYTVTTERNKRARPAPDLVERAFVADAPNQLWVADMTYVPTWAGFIYLAIVLDVWSRRIVGWAIGETMSSDLVISALNMALSMRVPNGGARLIHHSDQGSQGVFNRSSQQRVNLLMLSDLASPQMVFANQVFFEVGCLAQRQPHLARSLSSAIGQSLWESTDAAARSCFR